MSTMVCTYGTSCQLHDSIGVPTGRVHHSGYHRHWPRPHKLVFDKVPVEVGEFVWERPVETEMERDVMHTVCAQCRLAG